MSTPDAKVGSTATVQKPSQARGKTSSKAAVLEHAANELVFAVVGHVGSGTSTVATILAELLSSQSLPGGKFEVEILKARDEIVSWAVANEKTMPTTAATDLQTATALQDLGDEMRGSTKDNSAVARALVSGVRLKRAEMLKVTPKGAEPVMPDGKRRAYILDSLRHPEEVELLRHIYQEAFISVGVVCDADKRRDRIVTKYKNAGKKDAENFMERDAKSGLKHGQRVADTFHLSDYFIDNSNERLTTEGTGNPEWGVPDSLSRLIKIILKDTIVRPEIAETVMHHAFSASLRSACLSRQVGAALADAKGNIISTGTNEVPRAGGGVYGEAFGDEQTDHRCAFRKIPGTPFCSNTKEQLEIVRALVEQIPELRTATAERKLQIPAEIRASRIGDLLEFSRAVHAEMDALLSAARTGTSTVGSRLFVTTFPCHYCARHIVAAGVDEVHYIEPYPKSRAIALHSDSITTDPKVAILPSSKETEANAKARKVLFRPFVGVAPRMYRRAFLKDRDLKNAQGDMMSGEPEWGTPWHLRSAAYVDLEAKLAKAAI